MTALRKVECESGTPRTMPTALCCNCGTRKGVSTRETTLRLVRYMLLVGTEWKLNVALPHCDRCAKTAKRIPPSLFKKFLMWFFLTGVAFPFVMLVFLGVAPRMDNGWLEFGLAGAIAFGLVQLWYRVVRKPSAGQTSAFQAVRILKLTQKFNGEVIGVRFGFTNSEYADEFLWNNPEAKAV